MRKYSVFAIAREAMRGGKGIKRAFRRHLLPVLHAAEMPFR